MSGLIWSAHSKSTISSWVSTEYADPPPQRPSVTSSRASKRIEIVRPFIAIASLIARPTSNPDQACVRSSPTYSRTPGFSVRLPHLARRLRLADVNIGQRLHQSKDIQEPQHHSYDYDGVQD